MRTSRRLVLVAMVSGVLLLQAGAASAQKAPSRAQKVGAAMKRAGAATKKFIRDRVGVHPSIRQLKFGANLKLQQGDLPGATLMLKNPGIIASGGSWNFRERRAINKTQKKVNKAWKKEALRELGPGVPSSFNRPPAPPSPEPPPGMYL